MLQKGLGYVRVIGGDCLLYTSQHYAEKLTLPDVADKVYVSQWHLSKLIAKHTGQSFSDLLNGVRICLLYTSISAAGISA